MAQAPLRFAKMNGLGNEILVVDVRGTRRAFAPPEVRSVAAGPRSHFDQMMVLTDPVTAGTEAFIRIYNSDGSEARACGNGMRCVGLRLAPSAPRNMTFETVAGVLGVAVTDASRIAVDMGEPRFGWADIPLAEPFHDTRRIELQIGPIDNPVLHSPSVANVGNPHAIFWVDDVAAYDLGRFGPLLENHPIFPERANISLAHVTSRSSITVRTWERGAGLTKACGSAACATAVAAARKDLTDRDVTITLPGGPLRVEWRPDNHVWMTGPAELEYEGELAPAPAASV